MKRYKLLHIANDRNSYDAVADALASMADVVSVHSLEDARDVATAIHFDLAMLDKTLVTEPNFNPHSYFGAAGATPSKSSPIRH